MPDPGTYGTTVSAAAFRRTVGALLPLAPARLQPREPSLRAGEGCMERRRRGSGAGARERGPAAQAGRTAAAVVMADTTESARREGDKSYPVEFRANGRIQMARGFKQNCPCVAICQ